MKFIDFFDVQICETGEKQRVSREDANKVGTAE